MTPSLPNWRRSRSWKACLRESNALTPQRKGAMVSSPLRCRGLQGSQWVSRKGEAQNLAEHRTVGRLTPQQRTDASRHSFCSADHCPMAKITLSTEQKFRIEAACRELDRCDDIDQIRDLTKQLLIENAKVRTAVRQALVHRQIYTSAKPRSL